MSCKYRVRKFYSKGAYLVLAWMLLASVAARTFVFIVNVVKVMYPVWLGAISISLVLLITSCLGLLAHSKLQDYTISRIGFILLFLVTMVSSIYVLVLGPRLGYGFGFGKYRLINEVVYCMLLCLGVVALTCFMCILQLGLDQMPDASSSSITSFIAWIVFSISAGRWIGEFLDFVLKDNCFGLVVDSVSITQLYSLCPPIFASFILILDFLFAKSWLIIEPNPPKSFKTICQIVKFAAKHKAPLNRSALTYWEEDIPSRMDLGKLRYGGPFTTEQVEDVKSILRLLAMSLPIWLISFALAFNPTTIKIQLNNFTNCESDMFFHFTYSDQWWSMISTLINEFLIYPLLRDRLPSILKRIGSISFLSLMLSIVLILIQLFEVLHKNEAISILSFVSSGLLSNFFLCALMELVCAQAPYNMRRLFAVFMSVTYVTSTYAGIFISGAIASEKNEMALIVIGIKAAMSLLGFILYCVLARWYKRRVRDEDYNAHRVVEEVYDRYLTPRNPP